MDLSRKVQSPSCPNILLPQVYKEPSSVIQAQLTYLAGLYRFEETKLIKEKYNDLGKALDLVDFNNSANKIYSIHENAINKIKTAYSHFDISECTEFNKKSIIEFVFFLYSTFISVTDDELTNSKYEYNHFLYIQNGLSKIIGFKLYNTLVPIDKRKYIFPRNEFEEGYRSHVIITNMKDLYLDIYK